MAEQSPPSDEFRSLSVNSQPSSDELNVGDRYKMVNSIGEECLLRGELFKLLKEKPEPICYDGFEPSGRMHIAQGIMKVINVNKLTSAGCRVKIWIADWFAQLNHKMGGDLDSIKLVGQYFIEVWKAVGMDLNEKVEFLWASEEINSKASEYWPLVMDIARRYNLPRIMRCCQIMGRSDQDELSAAQIFYPCMQCADIFFLKADICQLGMDQRKVNVLAREYCHDIEREKKPIILSHYMLRERKPIILSHHMLSGLRQGQEKMSKSDPTSSIFMEDEEAELNEKIDKAHCPPKIVKGNPCLEYIEYIIFPWFNEFRVERNADSGGDKTFKNFEELGSDYLSGELHPDDLKRALSRALNEILQPVRDHFKNDARARDLLKRVKEKMANQSPPPPSSDESLSNNSQPSTSSSTQLSVEERLEILGSVGEGFSVYDEQYDELQCLLKRKPEPICYDGFEPSGRMHIAQGILKVINVNKLTSAGCRVKIWIADWFALLNNKLGGDFKKIRVVGQYLIEIWKAMGMDLNGMVEFLWSSDEINSRAEEYWPLVMDIARRNKLPRITRCCEIMGRSDQDELSAGQIFYPCMQCADIFFLKADICQLGMDQKEVNMLAREYCDDVKGGNKPIVLSHHILPGLQQGQEKMSNCDPTSAIFMEDDEAEVNVKIKKAYCPPKAVKGNPCLEYAEYIIFPWFNEFRVERNANNGGDKTFKNFEELVSDYESGELHPGDLKPALSRALNQILQPVRDHFKNDARAKGLLKRVKSYGISK